MQAQFEVLKPDEVEMSMTIVMPMASWRVLRDSLPDNGIYPFYRLRNTINDLIYQAERHFHYLPPNEGEVKD